MSREGSWAVQSGKLDMDRGKGNKEKSRCCEEEKEISVFFANSRSIVNKIDTLRSIACTEELDIIGITETWLDIAGKHFVPEVGIDGYTFFHRDREERSSTIC